jgi:hypothetical protein
MKSGNPGYIKGKPLLTGFPSEFSYFSNATGRNITTNYVNQFIVK